MTQSSRPQADNIANYPAPSDPGPYSADQWAQYMQIVYTGDQQSTQGPLIRYLNELAVTTNATTEVYVNTGAGMVNGHLLISSESETFVIPAGPVATRIDIVAMVENNSNAEVTQTTAGRPFLFPNDLSEYTATPGVPAYSARLVIVRGADGAGAPVLDQTTALYMVELYRYTINNVPTISTLTDNRIFCRFSSGWPLRTRWIPCTGARNWTDSTTITRGDGVGALAGFELADDKLCRAYGDYIVPEDFASSMEVFAVIRPAASGNIVSLGAISYGLCGEAYTLNSDAYAQAARAVTVNDNNCHSMGVLTAVTKNDILTISYNRLGSDVLDTINDVVRIPGFYVTYVPDE